MLFRVFKRLSDGANRDKKKLITYTNATSCKVFPRFTQFEFFSVGWVQTITGVWLSKITSTIVFNPCISIDYVIY